MLSFSANFTYGNKQEAGRESLLIRYFFYGFRKKEYKFNEVRNKSKRHGIMRLVYGTDGSGSVY